MHTWAPSYVKVWVYTGACSLAVPRLVWEAQDLCATRVFSCKSVYALNGIPLGVVQCTAWTLVHSFPGGEETITGEAGVWLLPLSSGENLRTQVKRKEEENPPLILWLFFFFQLHNVKCHRDNVQSRLTCSPFKPKGKPKIHMSSSTAVQKSEAHRSEVRLLWFLLGLTIRSLNFLSLNVVICRVGRSHGS